MVLTLAGIEVQPEAWIAGPISGTVGVGLYSSKERVGRLHQLVGIEGWKRESQTTDSTVFTRILRGGVHGPRL